eukprot:3539276-Pleurochrysis_carterae.AAC.1
MELDRDARRRDGGRRWAGGRAAQVRHVRVALTVLAARQTRPLLAASRQGVQRNHAELDVVQLGPVRGPRLAWPPDWGKLARYWG